MEQPDPREIFLDRRMFFVSFTKVKQVERLVNLSFPGKRLGGQTRMFSVTYPKNSQFSGFASRLYIVYKPSARSFQRAIITSFCLGT